MSTTYDELVNAEAFRRALLQGNDTQAAIASYVRAAPALDTPVPQGPVAGAVHQADLGEKSDKLSAASPRVQSTLSLRMTHIPLAMVQGFDPEQHPLVTVALKHEGGKAIKLRSRCWVEAYSSESVCTIELAPKGQWAHRHLPTFSPFLLRNVAHPVRATVHVDLTSLDGMHLLDHTSFRVWLLPCTTVVLSELDPAEGKWRSLRNHLTSWVTPDDASVTRLLRSAADRTAARQLVGYQPSATSTSQVQAMFEALHAHGLTYVNSINAVGTEGIAVQRVRPPRESLRVKAANCLDGAVLYASLMEAASLQAGIVLIPGHAFAAWRVQRDGDWQFLETTLTASGQFDQAVEVGAAEFKAFEAEGKARLLDISQLRRQGYFTAV